MRKAISNGVTNRRFAQSVPASTSRSPSVRPIACAGTNTHFARVGCARQSSVNCAANGSMLERLRPTAEGVPPDAAATGDYQSLFGLLIAPDRTAFRTLSIVARPPGAVPPHSNRVAPGVQ